MCFDDDSHPPMSLSLNSSAHGADITITSADGIQIPAYLAGPDGTAAAQVIVLPDAGGLQRFYKELALRFADIGVRALTIDYFARTAENDVRDESFDHMTHVQQMTPETFGQDLAAAVERIRRDGGQDLPTFAVGFCMGGSLSFWAGTRGHALSGVIGFYASLTRTFGAVTPAAGWAHKIQCPVLGLFGGADQSIPESDVHHFEHELEQAGIPHDIVVYPGAPHSFFDRKAADFATASADAWSRVQEFMAGYQAVRA